MAVKQRTGLVKTSFPLTDNSHSPGKIGHTTGSTSPTLFEKWFGFVFVLRELSEPDNSLLEKTRKTRKSNRLQMSLQGQHFLLSYSKILSAGAAGFATLCSAGRRPPK